ncbi:MAG TPA: TIM-barrel domain-containing protein, partial [Flavisolibacter sp.]|nr:TIM-barrel domain-containing protein [Flavisolibacter sp.]
SVLLLLGTISALAQNKQVVETNTGVVIYPTAGVNKAVRLKVVSPKIIQVVASHAKEFGNDTTLMVIKQPLYTGWYVENTKSECTLSTPELNAIVALQTGEVKFTDTKGKVILEEVKAGRKYLQFPIESGTAYAIQQSFVSNPDEAFYGLGQHQQGLMNYKGEQVELLQTNTEVAIPFLVSNKNYGILWDNYSITQFGDGRKYLPLNELKLFNRQGREGGLTASYLMKKDETKKFAERFESEIEYEFLPSLEKLPASFPLNNGKVIWEGAVQSIYSGLHKFSVKYGGYIKMWLDGKLIFDRWRVCWNPATAILPVHLAANRKHGIKIEWTPDGGESFLHIKWMRPATAVDNKRFLLQSEAADHINYYFVYGENLDEVVSGYRQLTGKAPIVPKWALGFWQSRERYKTQQEVMSTVKEFRKREVPIDNIVLDWQYWKPDEWGSQEFDPARFPDPKRMIDSLHTIYNTKLMISVWPKFYSGIRNFDQFNKQGWLLKKNIEENRKDWLGYVSTFYDAFNPEASKGFWNLLRQNIYTLGVDAWWMDAPEPDIHSNLSIEQRKRLMYPNAIGSAIKYFNAYPLVNARPIYEGQRADDPVKRVFILTRSAYAGSQRYGASVWSGDIGARWHDMKDQISAGVNFSLSGLPYWTMDIGGFAVERRFETAQGEDLKEWKELMTRWYQFGAFCPLFRVHGQYPYREIFNVANETDTAYQSMLYYNKLRYRMLPYIYSLAGQIYFDNSTIMRGLVMDFPADKNVLNINDQYLFGPSLLISPVSNYRQRSREIYLPKSSGWYDLYTGICYNGGQRIVAAAAYDRMPVFVKEGSIIPFGPELQYTSQKPADTIHLFVYTGRDASFRLYEDEGINYNYEKGQRSFIQIQYSEATKTLSIGAPEGDFKGMLTKRVFLVTTVRKDKATSLKFDQSNAAVVYDGNKVILQLRKS